MSAYSFTVESSDGAARRARASFARGVVELPAFMPVGTYATVKAMTPEELDGLGVRIIVANTFHLMLRPGAAVVEALGGLHRFMHWEQPDPHRLGRLSGVQSRRATVDFRGGCRIPAPRLTARRCFSMRSGRWRFSDRSDPTW